MKEGFELKSFCVKVDKLTEQEAVDMLDRCVELGAFELDGVKHDTPKKYFFDDYYKLRDFNYIGITTHTNTYLSKEQSPYLELLTKQEMLDYLGLYECGDRLLVKKDTVSKETDLKLGSSFKVKLLDNTEMELNITEPCKITMKGGWLEITPISGES